MTKEKRSTTDCVYVKHIPPRLRKEGEEESDKTWLPDEVVLWTCGVRRGLGVIRSFSRTHLLLDSVHHSQGHLRSVRVPLASVSLSRIAPDPEYPQVVGWRYLMVVMTKHLLLDMGAELTAKHFMSAVSSDDQDVLQMIALSADAEIVRINAIKRIRSVDFLMKLVEGVDMALLNCAKEHASRVRAAPWASPALVASVGELATYLQSLVMNSVTMAVLERLDELAAWRGSGPDTPP